MNKRTQYDMCRHCGDESPNVFAQVCIVCAAVHVLEAHNKGVERSNEARALTMIVELRRVATRIEGRADAVAKWAQLAQATRELRDESVKAGIENPAIYADIDDLLNEIAGR